MIRTGIFTELPCDYDFRTVPDPKGLVLLLHGYLQSGSYVLKKFGPHLPPDYSVLAPNAPFPVPGRGEDRSRLGFTWYFYDFKRDEYYIDMAPAVSFLSGLVRTLGLEALPKTIIGYSQGGYLAPFVAQKLAKTARVIGVACEFLNDEIAGDLPCRLDAIHGEQDEIVSPGSAAAQFAKLKERGNPGRFHWVPSTGHKINEAMQLTLDQMMKGEI